MKIVYDPPKRLANLTKHGLDFADLENGAFFETALVCPAKLGRFQAIGRFEDGTIAVVFAMLGSEGLSVVSMRPASKKERSLFDAHHQAH
ncbi:MAG: BrnT family toxin [Alphaproteobacteria bacterium]